MKRYAVVNKNYTKKDIIRMLEEGLLDIEGSLLEARKTKGSCSKDKIVAIEIKEVK